jgi:sigma-B regulation protein RsbU (phosphoserine phosphatase)
MATSPRPLIPASYVGQPLDLTQVDDLLKLQKATQKITSILDLDTLIDHVVNDVARSFGCVESNIYLHDEDNAELVLTGIHACQECASLGKGHRLKIGKEGMVGFVGATGQVHYAPDVRRDPYYIPCQAPTLSEVAIPLVVEGQLVGVFVASHPDVDAFPPDQIRMLQALCSHVAVAVHNARRFQQERHEREQMSREAAEARTIQQALLPKSSPYIPGFAVQGISHPAGAVGGDWYDFIPLDGDRWGLVLADVSGKGTAAALLMSATRGMLRSLAEACCRPEEVLTRLNRLMVADFPAGRFVTMVYGVIDPGNRTFTFANAGHLPPLIADSAGARFIETQKGLPLGVAVGEFSEVEVPLAEGSRLMLYTDGITEATDPEGEEYGVRRLQQHILEPVVGAQSILDDVRAFANGMGLHDDATVIFVKSQVGKI